MKKIPQKYLEEFRKAQTALVKSRVQLGVALSLLAFITGSAIINYAIHEMFPRELVVTWTLLICGCTVVFIISKMAGTLYTAKISAIMLAVVLLALVVRYQIVLRVPPFRSMTALIIMLFAIMFTIPWFLREVLGIIVLYLAAYTFYFVKVPEYVFGSQYLPQEFYWYVQGIVLLGIASCICFIVTNREREREIENFVLFKKVEENNRQMQKELELATRVHKRLVPESAKTDLADIAVTYLPAYYMGGDYAKFQMIDEDKLIFIICDVTGHGVPAALLVNSLHMEFERLINESSEPGYILKELDRFISKDFKDTNMLLTAFCGLLDYSAMKFVYSNHGHPPQYIYRAKHSSVEPLRAQTSLVGLAMDADNIYQSEIPFSREDQILLFTDGVTEARNGGGEEYGLGRLKDFIGGNYGLEVEEFNEKLVKEMNAFAGGRFHDDIFILNIRSK